MLARFALFLLCLALAGCLSHPRVTVYSEYSEAETTGGPRTTRTTTGKVGPSISCDLQP